MLARLPPPASELLDAEPAVASYGTERTASGSQCSFGLIEAANAGPVGLPQPQAI